MTVHGIFLTDLFEMDDIAAITKQLDGCTMSSGALMFDKVLNCKRVINALTFGEMWKQFFGNYPCSYAIRAYLESYNDVRVHSVCDFIRGCYPFIRHELVLEKVNNALALKPSLLIIDKIFYRYGYRCSNASDIMKFYTTEWKTTISTTNELCRAMCIGMGVPVIQAPGNIKKLSDLIYFQKKAIMHIGLASTNPFSGLHRDVPWGHLFCSLRDALLSAASEPSVVFQILDAKTIISDTTFVGMAQLLKVMVSKREKTLALASSQSNLPDFADTHVDTLVYYESSILHLLPKLAALSIVAAANTQSLQALQTLSFNPNSTISYAAASAVRVSPPANVSPLMTNDGLWIPLDSSGGPGGLGDHLPQLSNLMWETVLTHPNLPFMAFQQFVLRFYDKHKEDMVHKLPPNKGAENVVVLVDSRRNVMSVMSVLITYHNLVQQEWDVVIVCPEDAATKQWYRQYLGDDIELVSCFKTPLHGYNLEVYNNLMKNAEFWRYFQQRGYKRALIIQDDGMIVRRGLESKQWFDCDYVGAPWSEKLPGNHHLVQITKNRMVGNGGLSLRKLSAMVETCTKHAKESKALHYMGVNQEPEDVFFAKHAVNVPSIRDASEFSTETIMSESSLGFHKLWAYHSVAATCAYFNKVLGDAYQFKIQQRKGMQG